MKYVRVRSGRACFNAALIAAAAAFSGMAHANDGAPDPNFGLDGIAFAGLTTASAEGTVHPVVQADGKILYCSPIVSGGTSGEDFVVLRFNADGSPDESFSFDGKVTIDFDGANDACNALALQPDGKIIAVGSTYPQSAGSSYDFAIARLNADGSLDSTFGAGTGRATVAFDLADTNDDRAKSVALQPDGKIVVAGAAIAGANYDYDFAVARLSPDGTRDTTFNGTGRVTIPFDLPQSEFRSDAANSVVVDPEGRIILAGFAEGSGARGDFGVARLLPNGQLDDEFDADGRLTIAFDLGGGLDDEAYQTIVQRNGKIVVVGFVDTGTGTATNYDFAVVRLLPDGSFDSGFGAGGELVVPFDAGGLDSDFAYGVAEDELGRLIVAGGCSINDADYGSAVMRVMPNGTLDASFGTFGKTVLSMSGRTLHATGIALQGTQIILAGETYPTVGSQIDDFVARLEVDLLFADGFD